MEPGCVAVGAVGALAPLSGGRCWRAVGHVHLTPAGALKITQTWACAAFKVEPREQDVVG